MIRESMKSKTAVAMMVISLMVLPGCGLLQWFRGSSNIENGGDSALPAVPANDKSAVLVSMAGKPIVTEQTLETNFNQLLEDNPQLKAVLPLMPNAKHDVLMGMVSQAVVDKYIDEQGLAAKAEYKKELNNMMKSVRSMLNTKYFGMAHPVNVSDAEVKKFYEENKTAMPDLLLSHGGVKASGVSFDTEAAAKAFAAKVPGKDLMKAAVEAGLKDKVTDFKMVNAQSLGIDPILRSKVSSLKKFPCTEVMKDSTGKFWVVCASEGEAPKYRPFEQVQAGIRQFVEKEKRMEMLDKEINKLKEQYSVVVNEDYFKDQAAGAEQDGAQLFGPESEQTEAKAQKASTPKAARSA